MHWRALDYQNVHLKRENCLEDVILEGTQGSTRRKTTGTSKTVAAISKKNGANIALLFLHAVLGVANNDPTNNTKHQFGGVRFTDENA